MNKILSLALLALAATQVAPKTAVPYERIRDAREPANWLTYSGTYRGYRHSPLAEITPKNIAQLAPVWVYQTREPGTIESTPIVVDGVIYLTEHPHIITALDGKTGRPLWQYRRPPAKGVVGCCGPVNRGAAVLGDALYASTYDGRLLALDLKTGTLRWETTVVDPASGHSLTAAPLAVKDKIIVGVSGGEFGIRGHLDAYDAATGKRVWRLWTIPGPGEPGHETWSGESWKTGGAATWLTGTFDPDLNLLYWGTGNPAPDYNGDDRAGDNLYSNSLLAIDVDRGTLKWHFQFTPHDLHDWDSNQVPILVDATIDGAPRKLVLHANRNGFYYVLDRATGAFLRGVQYARQSWADGLDAKGRPNRRPGTAPSEQGTLVYPGLAGATNWFSPSYSPVTGLFYLQAREDYAQTFYKAKTPYEAGKHFEGGNTREVPGSEHRGVVKALDAVTGAVRWQFDLFAPAFSGVMSTAGGLVFGGTREGTFFALDATTGTPVWRFMTGAPIAADPISFAIDGRQHVAISAGQAVFVFALQPLPAPEGRARP
jgi:alcohol dehydrogenase (cytochrome c)